MGKRLVALSFVAALSAWPAWGQEDGADDPTLSEVPPVAGESASDAAPDEAAVAQTPVTGNADSADVASEAPTNEDPQAEDAPAVDPILPIGDEPIAEAEVDPSAAPDPDNRVGDCRADTVYVRGGFGKARFTVDVANTAAERAQGLMNVESMPASKGMLFVYPAPQPVAFWMKNTLIPLDMIFADGRGVVVKVHDSAVPGDLTSIPGGDQVQFVLEINGGMAGMLGISEGAELRHPSVRRAAWPC